MDHLATVPELTAGLFDPSNMLCSVDPRKGVFMTCSTMFRGKISPGEAREQLQLTRNRNSQYFAQWIGDSFKVGVCDIPQPGLTNSAIMMSNTSAVQHSFKRLSRHFTTLW